MKQSNLSAQKSPKANVEPVSYNTNKLQRGVIRMEKSRQHWGSRLSFVLAAAGSAIGLGNIWKFPYIAGENGGGAFVLIYLCCIAAIGIPVLIAELYIGQKSQKNPVDAFAHLNGNSDKFAIIGWAGVFSSFLILSFYSVVGGWVLEFLYQSITGNLTSLDDKQITSVFPAILAKPSLLIVWHTVFMALTFGIVLGGVKEGIEKWSRILMPTLLVILIGLFIQSMTLPGFTDALSFLFSPSTAKLTKAGILEAIGHAFFTLSLGMGVMMTYGSYLDENESLVKTSITVALLDTVIALVAGIVIFSIVFTYGHNPEGGPGLIFSTLPLMFSKMAGGSFLSIAFFTLVLFAALTSAISILETVVAVATERYGMTRKQAIIKIGSIIYLLGVLCALSFNELADFKPVMGLTIFDLFDKLTANILLPLGGMLISIYYGWVLGPKHVEKTIGGNLFFVSGLLFCCRLLAPLGVLLFFLNALGVIDY